MLEVDFYLSCVLSLDGWSFGVCDVLSYINSAATPGPWPTTVCSS